jgi:hypothetical protein
MPYKLFVDICLILWVTFLVLSYIGWRLSELDILNALNYRHDQPAAKDRGKPLAQGRDGVKGAERTIRGGRNRER